MLSSNAVLTLMIGPNVPRPAPISVIEALQSVQVNSDQERSGFQLTLTMGKNSALQRSLLPSGYFAPVVTRVIIAVTLNGFQQVLMDGFITRHEIQPGNEPGKSTLTVTGEDLSLAMDLVEKAVAYPGMDDRAKVTAILGRYAVLGIDPSVSSPPVRTSRTPAERTENQASTTDLKYIKGLAQRNGYVFFIDPGPTLGRSTAYFGPERKDSVPQPALNVNMDAFTNVESLNFSFDGMAKEEPAMSTLDAGDQRTPKPVPVPDVSAAKPPLGKQSIPPARIRMYNQGARLASDEARRDIQGTVLNNAPDISGSGSLDVMQYGRILSARKLVGVRGAGFSYDGLYYVKSVTHNIKPGEYKQSFNLSRDGFLANTETVTP
jgi:hypothetical protein